MVDLTMDFIYTVVSFGLTGVLIWMVLNPVAMGELFAEWFNAFASGIAENLNDTPFKKR